MKCWLLWLLKKCCWACSCGFRSMQYHLYTSTLQYCGVTAFIEQIWCYYSGCIPRSVQPDPEPLRVRAHIPYIAILAKLEPKPLKSSRPSFPSLVPTPCLCVHLLVEVYVSCVSPSPFTIAQPQEHLFPHLHCWNVAASKTARRSPLLR